MREIESTTIVDLSERAACSTCSWSADATDAADSSAKRDAAGHITAFPSHVVSVTRIALTLYRARPEPPAANPKETPAL